MRLFLNDLGIVCALGSGKQAIHSGLMSGDRQGLVRTDAFSLGRQFCLGQVYTTLPEIPAELSLYACHNNRMLLAVMQQIQQTVETMMCRYGKDRLGIVLGTSTSGVRNTEIALQVAAECGQLPINYHYKQQQMGAGADFLAAYLDSKGPAYTISTACSSSGKALASARRLLALDLCDAVVVGGADSLCELTVNGFAALESLSSGLCKPFGKHRDGINIGEAATLFVLSREEGPVCLSGMGATSDAYHFSAPDPGGVAVTKAMQIALDQAGLCPQQVDYLNLHGTATRLNDAMESHAVSGLFGADLAVSSSKGMTGHCLGAAAALELGFCWLLLNDDDPEGALIANINDDEIDASLPMLNWVKLGQKLNRRINVCMSNSFAFGGSNVSILLSRS